MVLAAITVALLVITGMRVAATGPALPVLEGIGGEFRVPGTHGADTALANFRGQIVLLNFGFTSCVDVCPTVLARMRALVLDLDALDLPVQPLFMTIDPDRDDLARLEAYLGGFDARFIGLRAPTDQLAEITADYRVVNEREDLESDLGYGFVHSSHIYLIDGEGRVRAMFGGSSRIDDMVAAVRQLAERG
jgi:protein SCO1